MLFEYVLVALNWLHNKRKTARPGSAEFVEREVAHEIAGGRTTTPRRSPRPGGPGAAGADERAPRRRRGLDATRARHHTAMLLSSSAAWACSTDKSHFSCARITGASLSFADTAALHPASE